MTRVTIYQTKKKEYQRFRCIGHSGYARSGKDIVCAAVSVLTINTINSLEELTHDSMKVLTNEKTGSIDVTFQAPLSEGGKLLMNSYLLGLNGIIRDYDGKYLELNFEEV